jgi:hypothetical protein
MSFNRSDTEVMAVVIDNKKAMVGSDAKSGPPEGGEEEDAKEGAEEDAEEEAGVGTTNTAGSGDGVDMNPPGREGAATFVAAGDKDGDELVPPAEEAAGAEAGFDKGNPRPTPAWTCDVVKKGFCSGTTGAPFAPDGGSVCFSRWFSVLNSAIIPRSASGSLHNPNGASTNALRALTFEGAINGIDPNDDCAVPEEELVTIFPRFFSFL